MISKLWHRFSFKSGYKQGKQMQQHSESQQLKEAIASNKHLKSEYKKLYNKYTKEVEEANKGRHDAIADKEKVYSDLSSKRNDLNNAERLLAKAIAQAIAQEKWFKAAVDQQSQESQGIWGRMNKEIRDLESLHQKIQKQLAG